MNIKTLAALSLSILCQQVQAQTGKISIDASKPGAEVSKNLYGVFFEEINHAGEGGIYGELIQNRAFEAHKDPESSFREGDFVHSHKGWKHFYTKKPDLIGWAIVKSGNANGTAELDKTTPLNENTPNALKLTVNSLASGRFAITNQGFWGIAVQKGEKYNLSFYARCDAKSKGALKLSLEHASGQVLAEGSVTGVQGQWKKFTYTFTATTTEPTTKLVIAPQSEGTIWLDVVSMFPAKTFKERPNGMRLDIAQKLDAMKPGFLRFPGGCIVEGINMDNRVKWKNTIGDIAKRPGHWILWDYHSSDGLGFHDYLQMCEDMGAAPMYVFPVGMSCQFRKCEYAEVNELQPYIDEVMDALEYALGPVSSKWGAERAKNGHPAPFKIKYVEVGNENYGPIYQEHYNIFFKAVKEKYPNLMTITCTDPAMRGPFKRTDLPGITQPIEIIDEHFYESTDFFYKNVSRYDTYDRNGPKVYVGEYAVKKWNNTLKGNLESALAEAAFMTGMERNAEVVTLSSYAPTFVNVNDRTWNPDMLVFNNHQSYGTPSYQVQKLFATNIPDRNIPVQVENRPVQYKAEEPGRPMLTLENPDCEVDYKDIKLEMGGKTFSGPQLFEPISAAKAGQDGWRIGKWGKTELGLTPEVLQAAKGAQGADYTLTMKLKADKIEDLGGPTIYFHARGSKTFQWNIGQWGRLHALLWNDNGYDSYFGQYFGMIEKGKWYDIKISIKGDKVTCYIDNQLIHDATIPKLIVPDVYASAGVKEGTKELIIKVVNATSQVQSLPLDIKGASTLSSKGEALVLTSENVLDENSFEYPEKVAPRKIDINGVSSNFTYSFLPYSVTVLKLKPAAKATR